MWVSAGGPYTLVRHSVLARHVPLAAFVGRVALVGNRSRLPSAKAAVTGAAATTTPATTSVSTRWPNRIAWPHSCLRRPFTERPRGRSPSTASRLYRLRHSLGPAEAAGTECKRFQPKGEQPGSG